MYESHLNIYNREGVGTPCDSVLQGLPNNLLTSMSHSQEGCDHKTQTYKTCSLKKN